MTSDRCRSCPQSSPEYQAVHLSSKRQQARTTAPRQKIWERGFSPRLGDSQRQAHRSPPSPVTTSPRCIRQARSQGKGGIEPRRKELKPFRPMLLSLRPAPTCQACRVETIRLARASHSQSIMHLRKNKEKKEETSRKDGEARPSGQEGREQGRRRCLSLAHSREQDQVSETFSTSAEMKVSRRSEGWRRSMQEGLRLPALAQGLKRSIYVPTVWHPPRTTRRGLESQEEEHELAGHQVLPRPKQER